MKFIFSTQVADKEPIISSVELDDSFAPDFLAWAAGQYFPLGVEATPAEGDTPAVYRVPTNQELHDAAWIGIKEGMAAHITDFRKRKAIATALAGVQEVA